MIDESEHKKIYEAFKKYASNWENLRPCFAEEFFAGYRCRQEEIDLLQLKIDFLVEWFNPKDTSFKTMMENFSKLNESDKIKIINLSESLVKIND